jgi:hypothetical protein
MRGVQLRIAAALLFAVTGCAGRLEQTQHDESPSHRGHGASAATTPSKPRPAPAIVQAASEMRDNPALHLVLVGPDALPARKAILRAGHGRIGADRVSVAPHGPLPANARPRVAFYFYVPDGRPLEERFPQLQLAQTETHSGVK